MGVEGHLVKYEFLTVMRKIGLFYHKERKEHREGKQSLFYVFFVVKSLPDLLVGRAGPARQTKY
jgi:hypothetical protein